MSLKTLISQRFRKRNMKTSSALSLPTGNALENYVTSAPSAQNAVDIFHGEWATKLPRADVTSGSVPAFDDGRIRWFIQEVKGVRGMNVLELGPLEGEHTFMLEQAGAASILAIEANRRAFLRCLITKEILKLQRATFWCGDFVKYLRTTQDKFDACLASGVLYHMQNPVELIALLERVSNCLYFWTHYYDPDLIKKQAHLVPRFPSSQSRNVAGVSHTLYRFEYQSSLDFDGFCGGASAYSNWLSRDDIVKTLRHFGFEQISIGCEQPGHFNGPAFSVLAVRSGKSNGLGEI